MDKMKVRKKETRRDIKNTRDWRDIYGTSGAGSRKWGILGKGIGDEDEEDLADPTGKLKGGRDVVPRCEREAGPN